MSMKRSKNWIPWPAFESKASKLLEIGSVVSTGKTRGESAFSTLRGHEEVQQTGLPGPLATEMCGRGPTASRNQFGGFDGNLFFRGLGPELVQKLDSLARFRLEGVEKASKLREIGGNPLFRALGAQRSPRCIPDRTW